MLRFDFDLALDIWIEHIATAFQRVFALANMSEEEGDGWTTILIGNEAADL